MISIHRRMKKKVTIANTLPKMKIIQIMFVIALYNKFSQQDALHQLFIFSNFFKASFLA